MVINSPSSLYTANDADRGQHQQNDVLTMHCYSEERTHNTHKIHKKSPLSTALSLLHTRKYRIKFMKKKNN